jgi:hypothetical protein
VISERTRSIDVSRDPTVITSSREYSRLSQICSNIRIEQDTKILADIENFYTDDIYHAPEQNYADTFVKGGIIGFAVKTFADDGTITVYKKDSIDDTNIQSNDLIQDGSYLFDSTNQLSLGDYILQEVSRRYSHGIECFEIECLFNDYYNENGELVFSKSDLSQHFNKYDVIIPYTVKRGKTVPLRKNSDGTPKKFRIIGISYSYDGLLKQKLSVQEERYDID